MGNSQSHPSHSHSDSRAYIESRYHGRSPGGRRHYNVTFRERAHRAGSGTTQYKEFPGGPHMFPPFIPPPPSGPWEDYGPQSDGAGMHGGAGGHPFGMHGRTGMRGPLPFGGPSMHGTPPFAGEGLFGPPGMGQAPPLMQGPHPYASPNGPPEMRGSRRYGYRSAPGSFGWSDGFDFPSDGGYEFPPGYGPLPEFDLYGGVGRPSRRRGFEEGYMPREPTIEEMCGAILAREYGRGAMPPPRGMPGMMEREPPFGGGHGYPGREAMNPTGFGRDSWGPVGHGFAGPPMGYASTIDGD